MSEMRPLSTDEGRQATSAALRTAGWGLAIYAATRMIGIIFASASMASAVAQAIASEWGAGRVGVTWSDPHLPMPTTGKIASRAMIGCAIGAGSAAAVVLFAWATRAVLLERAATPASGSLLAVGLVTAALAAMRDELLLHGIVLRVLASVSSRVVRALACGLTSGAAALGDPTTPLRVVASQFLLGVIFGALWVRDRGAWMAWGAHVSWLFLTGTLLGGGFLDARVAATAWGGGDAGILGGTATMLALGAVALVALAAVRKDARPNSPGSPAVG